VEEKIVALKQAWHVQSWHLNLLRSTNDIGNVKMKRINDPATKGIKE
jgi:hypothetical protein